MSVGARLTDTVIRFGVWDLGQSAYPNETDQLTDSANVVWTVKKVKIKIFGNLYDCVCIQNLP